MESQCVLTVGEPYDVEDRSERQRLFYEYPAFSDILEWCVGGVVLLLQFWSWEQMAIGRPHQISAPVPDAFDDVDDDMIKPSITYKRWGGTWTYAQAPWQVLIYYRD